MQGEQSSISMYAFERIKRHSKQDSNQDLSPYMRDDEHISQIFVPSMTI